jgi:hypothetical protein
VQESEQRGISDGATPSMGRSPGDRPQAAGAFFYSELVGAREGAQDVAEVQVFCTIPEQLFEPVVPGQPPLSRWTAQIESVLNPRCCAKLWTF